MSKDENGLINNAHGLSFEEFKWLKAKQKESEQKGLVDGRFRLQLTFTQVTNLAFLYMIEA